MFLVDSHCHLNQLDYENIHKDISDVLNKARKKGIKLVLSVSVDLSDYERTIENVGYRNDIVFSCGMHPINLCDSNSFDYKKLCDLVLKKNVVAIGETGLDYYRCIGNHDIQKIVFRKHIEIAKNTQKPLIVHSRDAIKDTMGILYEEKAEQCGGVLHCFSEDISVAKSLLNINFYISFSGIITFRNSCIYNEIIQYVPLDRILLETDSPYLAPIPYRGQENQPAYIYEIAQYIANIKNITINELACVTTSNFYKLFHILDK